MEKKKIDTINDCKNFNDIKEVIEDIIDQYEVMQSRINDYELTRENLIEAIEWFLNPVESEGRKDD